LVLSPGLSILLAERRGVASRLSGGENMEKRRMAGCRQPGVDASICDSVMWPNCERCSPGVENLET